MGAVLAVYCQYFRSLVVGLMLKSYNAIANLCGFFGQSGADGKSPRSSSFKQLRVLYLLIRIYIKLQIITVCNHI